MKQAIKSNNIVNLKKAAKASKGKIKQEVKSALQTLLTKANALHEQHNAYHEQYVVRGNAALYKLLGNILAVCLEVRALSNHAEVMKLLRSHINKTLNIKLQKNTPDISVIVRYIVRADRKTIHSYSRTIKCAIEAGITQATFERFIADRGGLERIRKSEADDAAYKANQHREACERKAVAAELSRRCVNPIATFATSDRPPLTSDTHFTLLLAVSGEGIPGMQIVGSAVPSSSIEQSVIRDYMQFIVLSSLDRMQPKFRERCKELGISEDTVLRWASFNQFATTEAARSFGKSTMKAANEQFEKENKGDEVAALRKSA